MTRHHLRCGAAARGGLPNLSSAQLSCRGSSENADRPRQERAGCRPRRSPSRAKHKFGGFKAQNAGAGSGPVSGRPAMRTAPEGSGPTPCRVRPRPVSPPSASLHLLAYSLRSCCRRRSSCLTGSPASQESDRAASSSAASLSGALILDSAIAATRLVKKLRSTSIAESTGISLLWGMRASAWMTTRLSPSPISSRRCSKILMSPGIARRASATPSQWTATAKGAPVCLPRNSTSASTASSVPRLSSARTAPAFVFRSRWPRLLRSASMLSSLPTRPSSASSALRRRTPRPLACSSARIVCSGVILL
jgi:hypothetical protein